MKQKYWKRICDMQKKQTEKGINKYGLILEENTDLSIKDRITYLEEELIDGLMYAEHIKEAISSIKKKIIFIPYEELQGSREEIYIKAYKRGVEETIKEIEGQ